MRRQNETGRKFVKDAIVGPRMNGMLYKIALQCEQPTPKKDAVDPGRKGKRKFTDAQILEMRALYEFDKLSVSEIAGRFGMASDTYLRKILMYEMRGQVKPVRP